MAENIIHLVLARTPTAPEGVKGISLFVVPKFLVNADGSLGERNDAYCVSIEHKLGIHASPTAIMAFGDHAGAVGYLVGEENRGLEYMFIMMNAARFGVGLEGVAACERAYQRARDYARDRIQCTDIGVRGGPKGGDHQSSRCPSHADDHEIPCRGDAGTGLRGGGSARCRGPPSRPRTAQTQSGFRRPDDSRSSRAGAPNPGSPLRRSACRCTAAWAMSRKPAPRSTCGTRRSRRSTRGRPASRRTT
jgi:hypothetical protein